MSLVESLARKPAHAYLVIGATATQFAKELAQHLFCPIECRTCPQCTKLAHGTHPDLTWVSKSGKRISIDQVRELQQKALYPPVQAPKKIYVIESVEDLSLEAANSLLKILEAPPHYLIFLLLAKSATILPTILSRCQIVKLPTPPRSQIERLLRERGLSDAEIEALLSLTKGSLPDAPLIEAVRKFVPERPTLLQRLATLPENELWDLLAEKNLFVRREAILEVLRRLRDYSSAQVLALAATLSKCDPDVIEFFIQEALYEMASRVKAQGGAQPCAAVHFLETAPWKLQRNANVQLLLESLLFTLRP
jgi:DNA polymerase-3 subunit delta'